MSFNQAYYFPTLITNITSLNGGQFGNVQATDVYPAVDVRDVTQSPQGTTKPYQIIQLINFILGNFGFDVYLPVQAASTANLNAIYDNGASGIGATLTNAGMQTAFVLDGIAGILNARYLIKSQTSQAQNGIYTLTTVGDSTHNWVLTRSADFNQTANIIEGGIVYVIYGVTYENTYWQDTFIPPVVVGTTAILWAQWSFPPVNFVWTNVTGVSVTAEVNHGYIADRSATPVQILLPDSCQIGDTVIVMGKGTGGWSLIANSSQTIQFGSSVTSMAGAVDSELQYDNIQVRCLVPNTTWEVTSVFGNPSII